MKKKHFLTTVLVIITIQLQGQIPTWPLNSTLLAEYNLNTGELIEEEFFCVEDSSYIIVVHETGDSHGIGQNGALMSMCVFAAVPEFGDSPIGAENGTPACDIEIFFFDDAVPFGTYYILFTSIEDEEGCTNIAFTGLNTSDGTTPVEFGSIRAEGISGKHRLIWETLSEVNNEKFIVERSTATTVWKEIGEISGNGTTYEKKEYAWVATPIHENVHYYRIKQVDTNGQYTYSQIVSITHDVVPRLDVFDLFGRHIRTIAREDIDSLYPGIYILKQGDISERIYIHGNSVKA